MGSQRVGHDLVTKPAPFCAVRLIVFPSWLATVIIHLFFVWPLTVKTGKHLLLFDYVIITHLIPCIMIRQQKNNRILYHQNYHLIEKPVITF